MTSSKKSINTPKIDHATVLVQGKFYLLADRVKIPTAMLGGASKRHFLGLGVRTSSF